MPYVPVPKDLTKVKTKVAAGLTKRQLICFSLGGLVGLPAYFLTRGAIGNSASVLLMIGLMCPFSSSPCMSGTGSRRRNF